MTRRPRPQTPHEAHADLLARRMIEHVRRLKEQRQDEES